MVAVTKCPSIMGCLPFMEFSAIEFTTESVSEITVGTLQAWRGKLCSVPNITRLESGYRSVSA
jgi:hypothetical protein